MTDEQVRRTLLIEAHRCIENGADEAVMKIGLRRRRPAPAPGPIDPEALLAYPPNSTITKEEEQALRSMELSSVERSALKKLIADGCAAAFFHFLNLIDAAGDPEVEPAQGTWLGAPRDDRDQDMLHDWFHDSYARYEKLTRGPGASGKRRPGDVG
jgi:hypothetical protein